jgi:hypothetical protein
MKRAIATALLSLAAATLAPRVAVAQGKGSGAVDACIRASEDTQKERANGHLRAARARSAECLDARCPTPIRRDCDTQASEIERLMPTIVFRVRAPDGSDVAGASVEIDGVVERNALDGRAHEIDPGSHEMTATADGYAPAHARIVVEEGVRARVIELRPTPQATTPGTPGTPGTKRDGPSPPLGQRSAGRASTATWIGSGVLAGVGVAGIGIFAGLGLSADADFRRLRDTCGGACDARDADSVRTRFQVADVALAVGVVALAAAVVVYLVGPREEHVATAWVR